MLKLNGSIRDEKRSLDIFECEVENLGLDNFYDVYKNELMPNFDIAMGIYKKEEQNNLRIEVKRLRKILEENKIDEIDRKLTLSVLESYYIDNKWLLNDSLENVPYTDDELLFKTFDSLVEKYGIRAGCSF